VTCKFVTTYKRPKVVAETGFGDQMEFADAKDDETVFTCNAFAHGQTLCAHAGKERLIPITCEAWSKIEPVRASRLAELDAMIAARDERTRQRGDE